MGLRAETPPSPKLGRGVALRPIMQVEVPPPAPLPGPFELGSQFVLRCQSPSAIFMDMSHLLGITGRLGTWPGLWPVFIALTFAGCTVDFGGHHSQDASLSGKDALTTDSSLIDDAHTVSDATTDGLVQLDSQTSGDGAVPTCGNGLIDPSEECDGDNLAGRNCTSALGTPAFGELACSSDCHLDTTGCHPVVCGDGIVSEGEECDDGNQSNEDDCLTNCHLPFCGDGYLWQGHEECDGTQLAGQTCESLGYATGTIACRADCHFDTSGCVECGACKSCTVRECYRDIYWWEDENCTEPVSSGCTPCTHFGPANSTHEDGSFFCLPNGNWSPYWNGGPCDWLDTQYENDCEKCGSWTCN